ncbi:hypothetical protein MCEROE11_00947 [Candidatus Nanopelagicaceae bacterium]
MTSAILIWTFSSLFIAIPLFAFISFLFIIMSTQKATRVARTTIKRDEAARQFDALNLWQMPQVVRPSQSRLLKNYLAQSDFRYRAHSDELFSFNSDELEIYLKLSPTSDGFTLLTLHTSLAKNVGLTSRIKNHDFKGLNSHQTIQIANERYNFGDLLLLDSRYFDNSDADEFQLRIGSFKTTAETCSNQLGLLEVNLFAAPWKYR